MTPPVPRPTGPPAQRTPANPTATDPPADEGLAGFSQEVVRLTRAMHRVRAHLAERAPQDVEWSSYVLLLHLVRGGPRRSGHLADLVHVDPSTVSRQVAQLVRSGLAERTADPDDGRAALVAATPAGHQVHADIVVDRDALFSRVLQDWKPADLNDLVRLLGRLNDDLDSHRPWRRPAPQESR